MTTENYQFHKFRTAGVIGNAIINSQGQATILYVQPEMKFRSPPGHFHHEPPLLEGTVLTSSFFHLVTQRCTSGTTAALGPISS